MCSWIRSLTIIKIPILPKGVYRLSRIPVKILWKKKKHGTDDSQKTILKQKNKTGGLRPPDSKTYCKTTRITTVRSGEKDTEINGRAEKVRNGPLHIWSIDFSEKRQGH